MYSKHHAAVSLVVASALAVALDPFVLLGVGLPAPLVAAYGTALGVFVDLDHFLIARTRTGNWDALRFCLRNPAVAFGDQSRIFETGDVGALSRLLSHLLITGFLVPALAVGSAPLAILSAVVLYVHVLTDVAWDVRRLDRADRAPDELARELR